MISYKMPKIDADQIVILDAPVAGDTALANGVLKIKDAAGNIALSIKASDLISFTYNAYSAGTANEVDVQLSGATLVANTEYSLTIYAPYVKNFFQGGKETGATYQARTYKVGVDGTPTTAELAALFVARINDDANAYFSAAVVSSTKVRITADSAEAGALVIKHTVPGTVTITDNVAWATPAGTVTEAHSYVTNNSLITAAGYNRYYVRYRKVIRHNAVTGLQVIKPVTAIVYINKDDSGAGAAVTLLTSILNGSYGTSYATLAKYCGCPAV